MIAREDRQYRSWGQTWDASPVLSVALGPPGSLRMGRDITDKKMFQTGPCLPLCTPTITTGFHPQNTAIGSERQVSRPGQRASISQCHQLPGPCQTGSAKDVGHLSVCCALSLGT